jgi:hypothetical protein
VGLAREDHLRRSSSSLPPSLLPSPPRADEGRGDQLPENDDLQTMWAPDVHKIKPFSAVSQLLFMFGAVAVFSAGVYVIQAPPPAVSHSLDVAKREKLTRRWCSSRGHTLTMD